MQTAVQPLLRLVTQASHATPHVHFTCSLHYHSTPKVHGTQGACAYGKMRTLFSTLQARQTLEGSPRMLAPLLVCTYCDTSLTVLFK